MTGACGSEAAVAGAAAEAEERAAATAEAAAAWRALREACWARRAEAGEGLCRAAEVGSASHPGMCPATQSHERASRSAWRAAWRALAATEDASKAW